MLGCARSSSTQSWFIMSIAMFKGFVIIWSYSEDDSPTSRKCRLISHVSSDKSIAAAIMLSSLSAWHAQYKALLRSYNPGSSYKKKDNQYIILIFLQIYIHTSTAYNTYSMFWWRQHQHKLANKSATANKLQERIGRKYRTLPHLFYVHGCIWNFMYSFVDLIQHWPIKVLLCIVQFL